VTVIEEDSKPKFSYTPGGMTSSVMTKSSMKDPSKSMLKRPKGLAPQPEDGMRKSMVCFK
jgi:hypothetical protein